MAGWVGAQGQVNSAKKLTHYRTYDITHKKSKSKLKIMFKLKQEDFTNP